MTLVIGVSVREYITYGMKGKSDYGIEHYGMPKCLQIQKVKTYEMKKTKRTTYLDH